MRLLADECIEVGLVQALRSLGIDVLHVRDVQRGGTDEGVLALAAQQRRVLLTDDKDFGDLVVRRGLPCAGILLLRVEARPFEALAARLAAILADRGQSLGTSYAVVEPDRVRLRPLVPPQ